MAWKELIYAWRGLAKSPVFTATAVLTIALGIGAATAIFSVANAVLLRPLRYKDSNRLVMVWGDWRRRNVNNQWFSNTDFVDLRGGAAATFEELGGATTGRAAVRQE